ncbi:hypothetical protein ACU8KH_05478 [Lachancea thermotolerans]
MSYENFCPAQDKKQVLVPSFSSFEIPSGKAFKRNSSKNAQAAYLSVKLLSISRIDKIFNLVPQLIHALNHFNFKLSKSNIKTSKSTFEWLNLQDFFAGALPQQSEKSSITKKSPSHGC